MKKIVKTALLAFSLLLSAGLGFAADVKSPSPTPNVSATDSKDVAKGKTADAKTADAKTSAKIKLIDINIATEAELKAVSGIGDAYAAKIIAGRPYASKAQLKSRKVLPGTVYEQIKDMIIAKQLKK